MTANIWNPSLPATCLQFDNTALHEAADGNHFEIVAVLLQHNASVNLQNQVIFWDDMGSI